MRVVKREEASMESRERERERERGKVSYSNEHFTNTIGGGGLSGSINFGIGASAEICFGAASSRSALSWRG